MTEKKYSVYIHTNKSNQKRYVGMTCLRPTQRWGAQGWGYRNQSRFYEDILAFGWDNFEHEIAETGLTKEAAQALEIALIKQYDTCNPEKGYNKNCDKIKMQIEKAQLKKPFVFTPGAKKPAYYCIELNQYFISTSQIKKELGIDASAIGKVCRGERASAGKHPITGEKLHWQRLKPR